MFYWYFEMIDTHPGINGAFAGRVLSLRVLCVSASDSALIWDRSDIRMPL